jgi:hypothetical protein
MSRTIFSIVAMGMISAAALFAAGCTSDKPAALTGNTDQVTMAPTAQQQLSYTDQKGHYRPDLANAGRTTR